MTTNPIAFAAGLICIVGFGATYRFLRGLRLNLLLIQREPGVPLPLGGREGRDQVVIPVTLENRRALSWRGIREKRWQESVDLVLADDEGRYADLAFTFHPWRHFQVELAERAGTEGATVKLNSRPVPFGRKVRLMEGDRLEVGRRRYFVRVTSATSDWESVGVGSI